MVPTIQTSSSEVKVNEPHSFALTLLRHREFVARTQAADCPDCFLPMRYHRGVTGTKLSCQVAAHVHRINERPEEPARWNDPRPRLTAVARAAMVDGTCGPVLEIFMASFTNDEQLAIAHQIVTLVIAADRAELESR